jgi:hypothetical protein
MASSAHPKAESLQDVYQSLHTLLSRYAPPFKTTDGKVKGKKDLHLVVPEAVAVPGAYGGKPTAVAMASIILQKSYVGFYFMPIYMKPALGKKLSPALKKLLKGKTCFQIKKLDPNLLSHVDAALNEGVKCFKERGWVK